MEQQIRFLIGFLTLVFFISGFVVIARPNSYKTKTMLVTVSILLCIFVLCRGPMLKEDCREKAVNAAYAGEVVDKEIINAYSSLLISRDMDYRVVIAVAYEFNKEQFDTTKSISVDKETYLSVDIGDWFDSHTLETAAPPV